MPIPVIGAIVGVGRMDQRNRIRVDGREHVVERGVITGAEVLALVNKHPGEWSLNGKRRDGTRQRIGPEEVVNLSACGIERFETVPMQVQQGG